MAGTSCSNCKWWRCNAGAQVGTCHAHPPVPVFCGEAMKNPVSGETIPLIRTWWPETIGGHFCGDFAVSPATLKEIDFSSIDLPVEGNA